MRKKENPIRKTTTGKGANYRKTKSGAGMTAKGVKAYRAANPGSKLKTAVTGKVKKGSAAAKRRKSYCARSAGQLKNSSAKTKNDPNSRIRQARRRWKCQIQYYQNFLDGWMIVLLKQKHMLLSLLNGVGIQE